MASDRQRQRDAKARALGFRSDYDRRNQQARAQGYKSLGDRRQKRAAGDYSPQDPAKGTPQSQRRSFRTPGGRELRRTTQGRQGAQDIARRMAQLDPSTVVTVHYAITGVDGPGSTPYEGSFDRTAGNPDDPGDDGWWDWDEVQDDAADDQAAMYGARSGAPRSQAHTNGSHSWVSVQGASLASFSVTFS